MTNSFFIYTLHTILCTLVVYSINLKDVVIIYRKITGKCINY